MLKEQTLGEIYYEDRLSMSLFLNAFHEKTNFPIFEYNPNELEKFLFKRFPERSEYAETQWLKYPSNVTVDGCAYTFYIVKDLTEEEFKKELTLFILQNA